jgi:N-hydroxyarylamine O-acetyltransferase
MTWRRSSGHEVAKALIDAYFARIRHAGDARPILATLKRIHALHAEHIPFENLSPFLGEAVPLDIEALRAKLLESGRGGWCFEHNILFWHVLTALGFEVTRLAARVRWNVPPGTISPRSHMLLLVRVNARHYIADVGFGGLTLTAPLALEPGVEQATPHEPHRISAAGNGYMLEAKVAGSWQALYTFDLREEQLVDYERSSWYLANHPQSQFVTGIVAARAQPGRRHALRNTRYVIHHGGGTTEKRFITTVDDYKETLAGPFTIELPRAPALDARLAAMIEANPPTS